MSARKFASTEVDVFDEHVGDEGVVKQYERKMSTAHSHYETATEVKPDFKSV